MWCIPPKQSAEFVYHMEDVLTVYQQPPDLQRPVVCLDETFRQLIGEVREPLPVQPGEVERYDSVYVHNGVASIFVAFEPLAGWRHVAVTDHRRRGDWAHFVEACSKDRIGKLPHAGASHGPAQHALASQSLRSVCAGQGETLGGSARNPLHAQTWFLAQHGGN